jgi:regulatory protein
MPVITAIEKQKRRPYADIHLDGVLGLSLRLDSVVIAHLAVGDELDAKRRREIEAADQRLGSVEASLHLVAMGPRSEKDLRDRLRRKSFTTAAIDHAVKRMKELGYLDDQAYARLYVQSRQASTPRSRRALAFELGRKGVNREIVSDAVEELSDAEAAYAAAQRRMRAFSKLDRESFMRRMGNFLASRGFGYGVARNTIERCLREQGEDVDAEMAELEKPAF